MNKFSFLDPIYCPSLITPHALLTLRTSLATGLCSIDQLDNLRGLTDLEAQGEFELCRMVKYPNDLNFKGWFGKK
jgi:hypothetical protein